MNYFKITILLLLVFLSPRLFSQDLEEDAKEHLKRGNYSAAIKSYQLLLKKDPSNPSHNLNIGISYLNTNIDKTLAVPYLEKALKTPAPDPETSYYLGMAYQYALKLDEAIEQFNKYKSAGIGKSIPQAERQIETCNNAKELIKYPIDVTFENLGPDINTEFPDYYPLIAPDESFFVFTTRRKAPPAILEFDGHYSSDVYISNLIGGKYEKAKSIGPGINTSFDEEAVGLSSDGDQLFIYLDHIKELGDIYISERKNGVFPKPVKQGSSVNSPEMETSASISPDGNTLFFTSNRKEGLGGSDIYYTRKLPNGQWAPAQNLGPAVNSPYNEEFPNIMPDGKTLYFSSQGHSSIGGYDIFVSVFDEETGSWAAPRNLGYPVNTTDNNMSICFSEDKKVAYISAVRKEGLGDLDIYRVIFNSEENRLTLIRGNISSTDTTIKNIPASILLIDSATQEEVGSYIPNPATNNYVIIIPPGEYDLQIDAEGFKSHIENISIVTSPLTPEIIKNYKLTPQ